MRTRKLLYPLSFAVLMSACEGAPRLDLEPVPVAANEKARIDLGGGHYVVFIEDGPGRFGAYEIGVTGRDPSILNQKLPAVESADELYAAVKEMLSGANPEPEPIVTHALTSNDALSPLNFDTYLFWQNYCQPLNTFDQSGCTFTSAAGVNGDTGNFGSTWMKTHAQAPDHDLRFQIFNKYNGLGFWQTLQDFTLHEGEYCTFIFTDNYGAGYRVKTTNLDPTGAPHRAFLAWGYQDAFPHISGPSTHPSNLDTSPGSVWTDRNQGPAIAADLQNWYFTSVDGPPHIWKGMWQTNLDQNYPFNDSEPIPSIYDSQGYDHIGDPDYDELTSLVFAPIDGPDLTDRVVAYHAMTLAPVPSSQNLLTEAPGAPWVAINPKDGRLYASSFYDIYSPPVIHGYEIDYDGSTFSLTHVSETMLDTPLRRIQGGAFSPTGQLYLVADTMDSNAGIHGFTMPKGEERAFYPINHDWDDFELEGIAIGDLDGQGAPFIGGQIHVVAEDAYWEIYDNMYFHHYSGTNEIDKELILGF
ncbi:MAG: hypothetical protein IT372_16705 [Polyangiaceae bacterium]|nr:hypothetical protein [Polyangiaceae bacterium]